MKQEETNNIDQIIQKKINENIIITRKIYVCQRSNKLYKNNVINKPKINKFRIFTTVN